MANQNLDAIKGLERIYCVFKGAYRESSSGILAKNAAYWINNSAQSLLAYSRSDGKNAFKILDLVEIAREINSVPLGDYSAYAERFVEQLEAVVQSFQRGTQSE